MVGKESSIFLGSLFRYVLISLFFTNCSHARDTFKFWQKDGTDKKIRVASDKTIYSSYASFQVFSLLSSSANCVNRGTTPLKNLYYNTNSLPSYLLVHS